MKRIYPNQLEARIIMYAYGVTGEPFKKIWEISLESDEDYFYLIPTYLHDDEVISEKDIEKVARWATDWAKSIEEEEGPMELEEEEE